MTRFLTAFLMICLALPAAAQEASAPPPRPAKLMALAAGVAGIERHFYGRVRAKETVDLAFQVGGQITEFPAAEGGHLARGALIAQLDLAPFHRSLEQARVTLAKARRDLERLQSMSAANVPEVQILDARTQAELARIAVDEAEDRLAHATLTAPFDALVARREVAAFTTVSAGLPVVRIHDMSELRVEIDVPEVLFRRAHGGGAVEFWATFPGDDARYALALREFEAETAEVGQTFRITLAFTDAPGGWLLPGASATVTALAHHAADRAVIVPDTALLFDAERRPYVMLFRPSAGDPDTGTVARTAVEIAVREDGRIALRGGLEPGAEIVMTGAAQLRDGQPVRRFTGIGG